MIVCVHVEYRREITLPPRKTELRYIGSPFLHRSCRAEIPVKDILSNLADLALVGMILFLWALSCQPHSVHKPLYPLMIDLVAALYQFLIYSSHTVAALCCEKMSFDFICQAMVSNSNLIGLAQLKIIGRPCHLHRFQQIFQLVSFFTQLFDDRCFLALSCVCVPLFSQGDLFFITSFSAFIYSFSARSRINSSRSDSFSGLASSFFIWGTPLLGRPFFISTRPLYPFVL